MVKSSGVVLDHFAECSLSICRISLIILQNGIIFLVSLQNRCTCYFPSFSKSNAINITCHWCSEETQKSGPGGPPFHWDLFSPSCEHFRTHGTFEVDHSP